MDNLLSSPKAKESSKTLKLAIFGSLLGLVCIAGAFVAFSGPHVSNTALSQFELEDQEFKNYINKYSKSYNIDQYAERFRVFRENLAFIRLQNTKGNTWVMGINQFTDLSPEEFKAKYLYSKVEVPALRQSVAETPVTAAPAAIDWRSQGAVTPVGTEGDCASDYAFASVGAVEGLWKISGNALTVLSEQEIVDCSFSDGNKGCNGGFIDHAYEFMANKGVTSAQLYPYTGKDGKCNENAVGREVVKITGFGSVAANNPTNLQFQVASGPVSVYVEANNYVWQYYQGGVISKNCGTELNHAVLIVGYNTTASPSYWIVKNSWGATWGENGYVRIANNAGAGVCGINMAPTYPTL